MADPVQLAECVINVSEGRDPSIIGRLTESAGAELLDVHADAEHNRSVFTLGGALPLVESASHRVAETAVSLLDITTHRGVHPRFGVVDVVPFVPVDGAALDSMIEARNRFGAWAGEVLDLPCFLYGPERSLPEIRRGAFTSLWPQAGPSSPHPTAGATAVGTRPTLVAYNVWITGTAVGFPDLAAFARSVAASLRSPLVRSLGLAVAIGAQVSFNLIDPVSTPVDAVYDAVAAATESAGADVARAELVGLIPRAALDLVPGPRWMELDLSEDRSIESRLEAKGYVSWPSGSA
jgi:glutamate formiminotransferase / 5-formyltetrahydrofolate cyclo-ligase